MSQPRPQWRVIGQPFAKPCDWLIQDMASRHDPRATNRYYPTRAAARAACKKLNRRAGKD